MGRLCQWGSLGDEGSRGARVEDLNSSRKVGGDRGGIVGQLEQVLVVADVSVDELDEGLEAEPVGDRQPAGGGVLSCPGRPLVQESLPGDLFRRGGHGGGGAEVGVAPRQPTPARAGVVLVDAGRAAAQLDRVR